MQSVDPHFKFESSPADKPPAALDPQETVSLNSASEQEAQSSSGSASGESLLGLS